MAEKQGFSDSPMTGYPPQTQPPPPGYGQPQQQQQQYGMGAPPQGQYGVAPPPYAGQPYAGQPYAGQPYAGQPYVTQPGGYPPAQVVVATPMRETGTPPDTTSTLIIIILSFFFCIGAWPFAVVAIIFNRKAKSQSDAGQYTLANQALRTCKIFIVVTALLGILAWVIFAIRLQAALETLDNYGY